MLTEQDFNNARYVFHKFIIKDRKQAFIPSNLEKNMNQITKTTKQLQDMVDKSPSTFNCQQKQIKAREKEVHFLSTLKDREKKKFTIKKKLFEIFSPLDEEENRLEQVIALSKVKSLPDIIKFNYTFSKNKAKVLKLLRLRPSALLFPKRNTVGEFEKQVREEAIKPNYLNLDIIPSSRRSRNTSVPCMGNMNRNMNTNRQIQSNSSVPDLWASTTKMKTNSPVNTITKKPLKEIRKEVNDLQKKRWKLFRGKAMSVNL